MKANTLVNKREFKLQQTGHNGENSVSNTSDFVHMRIQSPTHLSILCIKDIHKYFTFDPAVNKVI